MHVQSVVDLFAKQLYNMPKITNRRAIFHIPPSRRATWEHCHCLKSRLSVNVFHKEAVEATVQRPAARARSTKAGARIAIVRVDKITWRTIVHENVIVINY